MHRREFIGGAVSVLMFGCCAPGRTDLPPKPLGALRFLFVTDVHAQRDQRIEDLLSTYSDKINRQNFDFAIIGGDLINRGPQLSSSELTESWRVYQYFHRSIKGDKYPTFGNHDLSFQGAGSSSTGRERFCGELGIASTNYTFEAMGVHFIVVDTIDFNPTKQELRGALSDEGEALIRECLGRIPRNAPIVLVTHMPILTARFQATLEAGELPRRDQIVYDGARILEFFEHHNLILVLQGHLHVYEEIVWRGTKFVTGGAVSGRWWHGAWLGTGPGFCVVDIAINPPSTKYIVF